MTTSEQARADAMADAETLRQIGMPYGPASGALSYCHCSYDWIVKLWPGDEKRLFQHVRWAARWALDAVPGLRC